MNNNNTFAIAYKYHTLGRCVIPLGGGDKHKKALVSWMPYQTVRPDDAQLEEWQRDLNPKVWANCLVRTGQKVLTFLYISVYN